MRSRIVFTVFLAVWALACTDDDTGPDGTATPSCVLADSAALQVTLTWGLSADFDLLLLTPSGPRLPVDDVLTGAGTETIAVTALDSGSYRVRLENLDCSDPDGPTFGNNAVVNWALCISGNFGQRTFLGTTDSSTCLEEILLEVDGAGGVSFP